ncbi:MAG: hypothetical protein K9L75_03945 [Spirochaetia bacterium]|nr:hypothetical protein [Spirochaetia bacterium]
MHEQYGITMEKRGKVEPKEAGKNFALRAVVIAGSQFTIYDLPFAVLGLQFIGVSDGYGCCRKARGLE